MLCQYIQEIETDISNIKIRYTKGMSLSEGFFQMKKDICNKLEKENPNLMFYYIL